MKISFNNLKFFSLICLSSILLFGCGGSPVDKQLTISPRVKKDFFDKHFKGKDLLDSKHPAQIAAFNKSMEISEIQMIFDVSAGLLPAFSLFDEPVAQQLDNAYKATYFKCGHKNEDVCENFEGAINAFKNPATYGGVHSYIEGGLDKATEDVNKVSIFFTDFLYDYDSKAQNYQYAVNGKQYPINNKISEAWGSEYFERWFSSGGSVIVIHENFNNTKWNGLNETKFYALFFLPAQVKLDDQLQKIIDSYDYVHIDPNKLYFDTQDFQASLETTIKDNNYFLLYDSKDLGGFAFSSSLKYLTENEITSLGNLTLVNETNCMNNIQVDIEAKSIVQELAALNESEILGMKTANANQQILHIDNANFGVDINPNDINYLGYEDHPDVLSWMYQTRISNFSVDLTSFENDLTSLVRADGLAENFNNTALYESLRIGLENSKNSIKDNLNEPNFFNFYSFIWASSKY